jgi:ribonuclease P protein component
MALRALRERAAFEQLLGTRPMARSAHFAVHCLPEQARVSPIVSDGAASGDLSTVEEQNLSSSVDNSPAEHLLGCVLPKRLARRAVRRNLLRREIRSAISGRIAELTPGRWLVRLRNPWPPAEWHSAASAPFRQAVRAELIEVIAACVAATAAPGRQRTRRREP